MQCARKHSTGWVLRIQGLLGIVMDNARRLDPTEVFADPLPLSIAAVEEDFTAAVVVVAEGSTAVVVASVVEAEDFTVVVAEEAVTPVTSTISNLNQKTGE